jgi:apolipoprotein D and lipocalin family protein
MKFSFLSLLILALPASAIAEERALPPLRTVSQVDLPRYMGRWFEISSFPQRFQKGCTATTAQYSLREDGKVSVLNKCRIGGPNGKLKEAKGTAYAVDETNSKLRVSFFWPFFGDYWIVELGGNYEYAVVGAPDRDYLWILSRSPQMNRNTYSSILQRLRAQHFDISKLQMTGRITN